VSGPAERGHEAVRSVLSTNPWYGVLVPEGVLRTGDCGRRLDGKCARTKKKKKKTRAPAEGREKGLRVRRTKGQPNNVLLHDGASLTTTVCFSRAPIRMYNDNNKKKKKNRPRRRTEHTHCTFRYCNFLMYYYYFSNNLDSGFRRESVSSCSCAPAEGLFESKTRRARTIVVARPKVSGGQSYGVRA
jgi:hypothetical protein